jgi:hypothetical protein
VDLCELEDAEKWLAKADKACSARLFFAPTTAT